MEGLKEEARHREGVPIGYDISQSILRFASEASYLLRATTKTGHPLRSNIDSLL